MIPKHAQQRSSTTDHWILYCKTSSFGAIIERKFCKLQIQVIDDTENKTVKWWFHWSHLEGKGCSLDCLVEETGQNLAIAVQQDSAFSILSEGRKRL